VSTITAAPGSGLGSILRTGIEDTYGSLATIDKAIAVDSAEIKQAPIYFKGQGLHGGAFVRYDAETVKTNQDAGGSIKTSFFMDGMGRLIGSLMGSLGSAPTQLDTTTAYKQVHTFGSSWGQSLSFQQIIPDVSQVGHVWNVLGAKVTEGQFECSAGNPLLATFTVDAQDRFEVADGADVANPGGSPFFAWQHMTIKVGAFGSEQVVDGVSKWSGSIKRAQADKRFNAGKLTTNPSSVYTIKDEPVDNGYVDITGTLDTEYLDDTLFEDYYQTDTPFSLEVDFTAATLAGVALPYSVNFAFPCCRFLTGEDPSVPGPDLIKPSMAYEVMNDGVHPVATITIVGKDTAL
jgi:hypothetical protein